MYTRILVPLDGSKLAEQVLPYVRLLGEGLHSHVELLRVVEPMPSVGLKDLARGLDRQELIAQMTGEAQKYLKEIAASLRDAELTISSLVYHGDAASNIVSAADTEPNTLIAMSTHGRSGLARWALGSVTDKVLHATTNTLLIIRSGEPEAGSPEVDLKEIIIPLDESSLAEQILPHAVSLAKTLGLKMTLLRVTPPAGEYYRFMDYPPANFDDIARDTDEGAVEYLRRMGQEVHLKGISDVAERLAHGNPGMAITDFAQEVPNNLVAMTTHGRSGIRRWVMGSVADRVVRHAGGPVLVIRVEAETPERISTPNIRIRPA